MLSLALAAAAVLATGAPAPLAPPQIDVYTMGNGNMLFHRFGHAAMCVVYDDAPDESQCYNYGTTDFGSPPQSLGWDLLRGLSQFWVSVWPPDRMIEVYEHYDRSVWRQRIPLSPDKARAVAAKLAADAARYDGKGRDSYYHYHHYTDNCTTRVRDILDDATDGALRANSGDSVGVTFRELGRRGLADITGIVVASHFFYGRDTDVEPTEWQAMFLPRVMRDAIERKLGVAPELIYHRRGPPLSEQGSSGKGWLVVIALVVFLPTGLAYGLGRGFRVGLGVTSGLLTLVGVAIAFVMIVSEMPELRHNEALLVFWPSDFLLVAFGATRRQAYARVRVIALVIVSVALAVGIFRQPLFVPLLIPLAPMLLVALRPTGRVG